MNRNYVALAALALSTMVGCQEHGWSGKRAEDYKPLQYKGELEAADNTIRLERQRLSYLMPTAFRYTYGEEFRQLFNEVPTQHPLKSRHAVDRALIIPSQFSELKIISTQEQQRAIEEIANEKLYRTQSDPSHYENTKQAFQAEFKRRMSDKGLK